VTGWLKSTPRRPVPLRPDDGPAHTRARLGEADVVLRAGITSAFGGRIESVHRPTVSAPSAPQAPRPLDPNAYRARIVSAGHNLSDRGGQVAVTNADGDRRADVAVGSGAGRPAEVRVYLDKDFADVGEPPAAELDPFGGAVLADGVYVG
jgi:hypothetical protein